MREGLLHPCVSPVIMATSVNPQETRAVGVNSLQGDIATHRSLRLEASWLLEPPGKLSPLPL